MKRKINWPLAALLAFSLALFSGGAKAQVSGSVSFQVFYDELSPYGDWIQVPQYGYAWRPALGADFRPYSTGGHWAWSNEYEWIWISDYQWGWAPFHYGRWTYDDYYGWIWVPGYDWSPAWVAWRTGGDYYGWAPLAPGIQFGVSFSIGNYNPAYFYWNFVPRRYIASTRWQHYCLPYRNNTVIIHHTTIINNYYGRRSNVYVSGPRYRDAQRYSAQRIHPVTVRDAARPGRTQYRRNEVTLYRPEVGRQNHQAAPRNYRAGGERSANVNARANVDRRNAIPDRRMDRRNPAADRQRNQPAPVYRNRPENESRVPQRANMPSPNRERPVRERQRRETASPEPRQVPSSRDVRREPAPRRQESPVMRRRQEPPARSGNNSSHQRNTDRNSHGERRGRHG